MARTEALMDTLISIKAWGPPEVANRSVEAAFQVFRSIEHMASFHKPETELSEWNKRKTFSPSASMTTLLEAASEACRLSGGSFDPTFAILHRAYGFYDQHGRIPSDEELQKNLSFVGWDRMVSRREREWTLASGALVDLGGIAGGFAVDRAAEVLRQAGCPAFLIDDAGDLFMEGTKPDDRPWKIMVRDPRGQGSLAMVESRVPVAVSTSGDYERFVEVDGQRINHIFDPLTGKSAGWYRSVTVVASTSLAADTLSTALFAMSPERARVLASEKGIAVLFLPASGSSWVSPAGETWFSQVAP